MIKANDGAIIAAKEIYKEKAKMKLTEGNIFKTLFLYSLPLILTNVVQLLFHAADVTVLGIMVSDSAVAAVGACGPIISLLVSLFASFATGANILIAKHVGAKNEVRARKATGTAVIIGFFSGVIMMIVAIIWAEDILILMKCQESVLPLATTYMRIYFIGMPVIMLYNFVAAILRSVGDSLRPMIYMLIAGTVNVGLNVFFIGVCNLEVVGVALATFLSNLVSLVLAMVALFRNKGYCKFEFKNLRIFKGEFKEIIKIGVPACLCSLSFYIANLFVSAGVNSLSEQAMTAGAIAGQFDAIVYNVGMSIAIACMSMVGQCYGAGLLDRIIKTIKISTVYATVASLSIGSLVVIFSEQLLDIMTDSAEVIKIGREQLLVVCLTHFITSIMEVLSFSLRALKRPNCTLIVGFICGFGIRTFWVTVIWKYVFGGERVGTLFLAYGVSAFIAAIVYAIIFIIVMLKEKRLAKICKSPQVEV